MLPLTNNRLLCPSAPSVAGVEAELRSKPHLKSDCRYTSRHVRRDFRDARQAESAVEAMGKVPAPDEAIHLAVSGRFALWHMVPATMKISGSKLASLRIATLGFSKKNVSGLCDLIDAGEVDHVRLLASHYFKGTSNEIYTFAETELAKREGRADFLSVRTHAKLLLMELDDGRKITVESSANLRSCKNIEQMTIVGDPGLYDFHAGWMRCSPRPRDD